MATNELLFTCVVQRLRRGDADTVAADAVETIKARFNLCPLWAEYSALYARFRHTGGGEPYDMLVLDGVADVPHEVIKPGAFTVAIWGEKDGERLTSSTVSVPVAQSIDYDGSTPAQPTPTLLEQLTDVANDAAASALQAVEAAEGAGADAKDAADSADVAATKATAAANDASAAADAAKAAQTAAQAAQEAAQIAAQEAAQAVPDGGNAGDVLTKTEDSTAWSKAPSGLPEGGSAGQVLTKTDAGAEWQDAKGGSGGGMTEAEVLEAVTAAGLVEPVASATGELYTDAAGAVFVI